MAPGNRSNVWEDAARPAACDETPLIFPNQVRFGFAGGLVVGSRCRGLLVTSAMDIGMIPKVGEGIAGRPILGRLRTGVKPEAPRRRRGGVVFTASSIGRQSAVNPCGGILSS
jgi:hypothetical protein